MTLINASILGGVLLAGLPVLLHMIMRAKPKRIEFPALQLLLVRQTTNSRRMRLRHILLLVLRAIVIVVAVLALTRPSLPPARYGLRWYEWLAFVLVIVGCVVFYRWRSARVENETSAEHVLRERRGRLRVFTVLGGLLALLLFVGLPWGVRVQAELTGPRNAVAPDIPVSAVFVFDNSLSMTYKHESLERLEHAEQIALDHLKALPQQSRVAVATLDVDGEVVFQADLAGVRSRIEDLKTRSVVRPLNSVLKDAIEAHIDDREQVQEQTGNADGFAREIYLLTDFSEASWSLPDESGLHDLLVQHDWLQVYLIDVSVPNPINVSLGQLRLDREATVTGQSVNVSVAVSATEAASPEVALDLFILDEEGNEIRSGVQTVRIEGSPPVASFSVRGMQGSEAQQGYIQLSTPDPMPIDDKRYFTFGVSRVPRVLLIGDDEIDSWVFRNTLQPVEFEDLGELRFECKSITGAQFGRERLGNYDIVCLLNWSQPDEAAWPAIKSFVNSGGGLFIALGGEKRLRAAAWSTPEAQSVLPGIPLTSVPFREQAAQLNMVAADNPIVSSFANSKEAMTEIGWALFDKVWAVDKSPDARVLMAFNDKNRRPALLERKLGNGRTILFTSAVDNHRDWNEGLFSDEAWGGIMLADQIMQYLTGASETKRNFTVGDPVDISIPDSRRSANYALARPPFRLTPHALAFDESSVLLTDIDTAGRYQLRSTDDENGFTFDFAANDHDDESNLTHITTESLDEVLGKDRYSRVTDPQELDRAVNLGRLGIEVFPVLMGLLILLFCAEHLMANFFYDDEPAAEQAV